MKTIVAILSGAALGAGAMYGYLASNVHDEPVAAAAIEEPVTKEITMAVQAAATNASSGPSPDNHVRWPEAPSIVHTAAPVPGAVQAIPAEDRQDWLATMRENEPERYQEIMTRREEARKTTEYELAKRAAYFIHREDHTWTEEQAGQYKRMMELLEESLALTEQLEDDLPEEKRREIAWSIRRNMRELSPLLEIERDAELYRIGKEIGYSDDDAAAFVLYLRDVIDITSVGTIFRNSMRAMGGGGWWGSDGGARREP